jgi:hypothetical protein
MTTERDLMRAGYPPSRVGVYKKTGKPITQDVGGRLVAAYAARVHTTEALENGRYSVRVIFSTEQEDAVEFSEALQSFAELYANDFVSVPLAALAEFIEWSMCARDRMDHDGKRKWQEARAALSVLAAECGKAK